MAAPMLGLSLGSLSLSSTSTNLRSLFPSLPSSFLSFFSQRPCPLSLSIASRKPNSTFSTIVKFAESEAPVLEADPPPPEIETESSSAAETSEVVQPILPAPKLEEIFAVVMVGSRQYIVFPGRWIHTQRLKDADVNDKVLLVGTKTSTYVGKSVVTNAVVHAVVEEQLLDDKVVVFKYKKKKK